VNSSNISPKIVFPQKLFKLKNNNESLSKFIA
jgi:hypothetical protein